MSAPALVRSNAARITWVVVGAIVLTFGIGLLGAPVFLAMFGAPIDIGLAFVLAFIVDLLLAGIYAAGLLVARRRPDGSLRALPPALATGTIAVLSMVAVNLIAAAASR